MATVLIVVSSLIVLLVLAWLAGRGLIRLPDDPRVLQIWVLAGIPILLCIIGLIIGIYAEIAGGKALRLLSWGGPLLFVLLVGLLFGWFHVKRRRRRPSDVQRLDLDK